MSHNQYYKQILLNVFILPINNTDLEAGDTLLSAAPSFVSLVT